MTQPGQGTMVGSGLLSWLAGGGGLGGRAILIILTISEMQARARLIRRMQSRSGTAIVPQRARTRIKRFTRQWLQDVRLTSPCQCERVGRWRLVWSTKEETRM